MTFLDVLEHLYLPLLTQETAVMISTFTYGFRTGASPVLLVAVNTAAVITDLAAFFVPAFFLSDRLRTAVHSRFFSAYDRGSRIVARVGTFRAATTAAIILPSVAAMIVIGSMRLSFWRALSGLFVGSAVYVVVPLLVAAPLAPILPRALVPLLPWIAPVLALLVLLASLVRLSFRGQRAEREQVEYSGGNEENQDRDQR